MILARIKHLLKCLSLVVVLSILVFMAVVGLVLNNPAATRWLVNTVISAMDEVSIESVDGTLGKRLVLTGIHVHDPELIDARVQRFELIWNPASLLKRQLHISLLDADGITLDYVTDDNEQADDTVTDSPDIPFAVRIDQLNLEQLVWKQADSQTKIEHVALSAHLVNQQLFMSNLVLKLPEFSTTGSAQVALQNNWPLTAQLGWETAIQDQTVNAQLDLTGNLAKYEMTQTLSGFIKATQTGWVSLDTPQPVFDLTTEWQQLHWPLDERRRLNSNNGQLTIKGSADDYHIALHAPASIDTQSFNVVLQGHGDQQQFIVKQFDLTPQKDSQSKLSVNGKVNWANGLQFLATLITQQLNPSEFGLEIPASLDSRLLVDGQFNNQTLLANLQIDQLSGEVYDQPVNASGRIQVKDKRVDFHNVKLLAGRNQATINGKADLQQADLRVLIDAPDLSTAWPTLHGRMNGTVDLLQSLDKPVIKAQLQATRLGFNTINLDKLKLDIDYSHASHQASFADISINGLKLDSTLVNEIKFNASGLPEAHRAILTVNSEWADMQLQLDGDWNNSSNSWLGQIKQLAVNHPQLERWTLQHPVQLQLSQPVDDLHIVLERTCLQQQSVSLCTELNGSPAEQLNGNLVLKQMPLTLVQHWTPEDTDLAGSVDAEATFQANNNGWQGKLNAALVAGLLRFTDQDQNKHDIAFQIPEATAHYENDQLVSLFDLQLTGKDHIQIELTADQAIQSKDRKLHGTLAADISNLKLIEALVPNLQHVEGVIKTDLAISGSLKEPKLLGNLTLKQGRLSVPLLGTTYQNITLTASNATDNSQRIMLNGQLESGQGQVNANGYLDLETIDNMALHLALNGQQFLISRLPEAEVELSPDLEIDRRNNITQVSGSIHIDKAAIILQTLPDSAITPSEDEIIINQQHTKPKKMASSLLKTDIAIDFGDKTHFEGFGLEADLKGQLNYITKKKKPWMQGRAALSDATYTSYGQNLTIRKGEFLFNGPTDNPWLNIEAIRKSNDTKITAVLALSGPLKSPQTRIYSEPPLPESEALAYLITGKSFNNRNDSEGNAIASAAIGYGVSELSWLSEQLGIDEFEFEEGDKLENSAVRLGQYLNPDLYIGLSLGLFATNYAVDLRYQLNKHFSLATRAGNTQRIELRYHINTD